MELPECPVCLQSYNEHETIPRVLPCGHSICEACLASLPLRYASTIRCPSCTQLAKHSSPLSLPKNIDLLRFSLQNPNSKSIHNSKPRSVQIDNDRSQFCPRFWSEELYGAWKGWILPYDVVLVDSDCELPKFATSSASFNGRVCFEESQGLCLALIDCLPPVSFSRVKLSYEARVMVSLEGMGEGKRKELELIFKVCGKKNRVCGVFGLWGDLNDGNLYLVCERKSGSVVEKYSELTSGGGLNRDGFVSFSMMGLSICEALIALHADGLVVGCFGLSCFSFDELGGIYLSLNEALVKGRKVRLDIMDAISAGSSDVDKLEAIFDCVCKHENFICPEGLFELLPKGSINLESEHSRYAVAYGSDVWSLGCVLLRLLFGNALPQCAFEMNEEKKDSDLLASYTCWVERVDSLLEEKLGSEFLLLRQILKKCLEIDPGNRPDVAGVRKCIWDMLIKPPYDVLGTSEVAIDKSSASFCLILGELCQFPQKSSKLKRECELQGKLDGDVPNFVQDGKETPNGDFGGSSKEMAEVKDIRGHLDCITGLAVGGGFLFSSSFDKTINVWSLQDFSHLHTFRGHENKVMALVYVDGEEPLCLSGDSGGGIFVWGITFPFEQQPLRKWFEQKDWRFSGIHSMVVSRNLCLYTGSGDRSIKAWSLKDGTLLCTMNGHTSVVSTLAICDDVLYSGSWDGTIRLWSLNDHSLLTVLGEDVPGVMKTVRSITVDRHHLVASHENGCIKVWRNDIFMSSKTLHSGAIFAISMQGEFLYTGGWDKKVNIQELTGDEFQLVINSIGHIPCNSVITAILCWEGKLFVGFADKSIKVYQWNR